MDSKDIQKAGAGAKMVGRTIGAKGSSQRMGTALDKVSQGAQLPANLAKEIAPFAKQLGIILADPSMRGRFLQMIKSVQQKQKAAKPESIEEGFMKGYQKYHCKDCGCQMHNCKPDCDCSHDSHDEKGSWWVDANGNGVPDVMESAVSEGLADLADRAERDHEVQMARSDLYKIAKYAIKLHEQLKGVSEAEGLDGWVQAKITKAADYLGSVYHYMDYEEKYEADGMTEGVEMCPKACCGKPVTECSCGPECKHCDCYEKNKAMKEGKSPHKKGSAKYKKHMAAKHASMNDSYKADISNRLSEALKKKVNESGLCSECGNPSWRTLDEKKQKGVDGKVCWKGYKRMGTKKKGGKTVDNCVKM